MDLLYKVYEQDVHHLRNLPPSMQKDILSLIDGCERQELTPEERGLFDNIGKSSTLKEWKTWIAQIQDKTRNDRILDTFYNRLILSQETKKILEILLMIRDILKYK